MSASYELLESKIHRLALTTALVVALGIPCAYWSISYSDYSDSLDFKAKVKASALSASVVGNPETWMFAENRMERLLAREPVALDDEFLQVIDQDSAIVTQVGRTPLAPVLERSHPLYDGARVAGQVLVAGSLRELLWRTLAVAVLGLLFGTVVYAAMRVLPVRALRAATGALRASELRFRSLFENVPNVAVKGYDANYRVIYWNAACERMYGYSAGEALGRDLRDLIVPPGRRQAVSAAVGAWLGGGPAIPPCELLLQRKDRSPVTVFSSHAMLTNASGQSELFCVDIDLSQGKVLEQALLLALANAEKANVDKSRFLAAASHDLRQPLAALSLYVSVLASRSVAANVELVTSIGDCVDSLSDLLTNLLDVSKLAAGVVVPVPSVFAIDDVLAALVSVHCAEARLKGLRLRLRHSGATVLCDQTLLRRLLGNLMVNAVRYTDRGGVLIACRRHRGKLWVEVWDTGIGIAEDQLGVIFDEFKQLGDGGRSRGSGLGLAIVDKTAKLLGLEVRVRSRPRRGSLFAVELPESREGGAATAVPLGREARRLRIGLVDDNGILRAALTLSLQEAGHQVIDAASGGELIDGLGQRAPDIVIADYRLSAEENGFDVIKTVRDRFGHDLPAFVITGDTDPALIHSMADQGIAVHYKPFPIDALRGFVDQAIG